ncbi:MAG: sugar phosphate nucleotidyltransferase [Bdellovibrionales bacterium]
MRGLILSAGLGERLRPLTLKKAKPAIEFLNAPMLAFPYFWLSSLELSDIVFNTHYLPDTVRHAAVHSVQPNVRLHFSHEEEILGSGGGIWKARFDLNDGNTFAVANGDGVILHPDREIFVKMKKEHESTGALATILVCPLPGVGKEIPGVWIQGQKVVGFGMSSPVTGAFCRHYASYMLFSPKLWSLLPDGRSNILYDVLVTAIDKGDLVRAFEVPDLIWYETGRVKDYLEATADCIRHLREGTPYGSTLEVLLQKHSVPFDQHSIPEKGLLIANSARVEEAVDFGGFVVVGDDVHLRSGTKVEDCVLLPGADVPRGTYSRQVID